MKDSGSCSQMTPSFVLSLLKNFSLVVSLFFPDWGGEGRDNSYCTGQEHISVKRELVVQETEKCMHKSYELITPFKFLTRPMYEDNVMTFQKY